MLLGILVAAIDYTGMLTRGRAAVNWPPTVGDVDPRPV
jgi:hypothetical protein